MASMVIGGVVEGSKQTYFQRVQELYGRSVEWIKESWHNFNFKDAVNNAVTWVKENPIEWVKENRTVSILSGVALLLFLSWSTGIFKCNAKSKDPTDPINGKQPKLTPDREEKEYKSN